YRKDRYGLVTFPHEISSLIRLRDGGYLSGGNVTTGAAYGMTICKFDSEGSLVFEKRLTVNESCNFLYLTDVVEHNNGKLTVLGTNGNNIMIHLDGNGNYEYRKNVFSGGWNKWFHLSEEQGMFYVCGFRNQPFGASDTAYIGLNFGTHLGNFCDTTIYSFTVRDSTVSSVYDASVAMREVSIGAATPMHVNVQDRDFSVYVYERCTMGNGFAPFDDAVPNSVYESEKEPGVVVFPNPASTSLSLSGLQPGSYAVALFTADGKNVLETRLSANSPNVDLQALPSGLYFIETKNLNSHHTTVGKVVVNQ
ncbi:MAG TPA: T9SS type A sorting domain-containing protein, partial [Chitinophagales bacterium]|nr:T9SS type A sorting domain-containing protein [Chitinophagales bacterium]